MHIPRRIRKRHSVIAPQVNGGRNGRRGEGALAPIGRRTPGPEFSASLDQLRKDVQRACSRQSGWEARVVAGITAALEFAAAHPGETRALTIDAHRTDAAGDRQDDVIAYFTKLFADAVPSEKLFPITSDRAMIASIAMIIRSHLVVGSVSDLPDLAPDLSYLILMPYTGLTVARREAERSRLIGR
jgi:hypothetical protein